MDVIMSSGDKKKFGKIKKPIKFTEPEKYHNINFS